MRNIIKRTSQMVLPIILLIFISYVCSSEKTINIPSVFNDEFGYWGNASAIAGKDWHSLMAQTPFYSMGYSLTLVPLFFLNIPMESMYKFAIALNVIYLCVSYYCALYTVKIIFPENDDRFNGFIAFVSIATCSFLFYSQLAWCESLLFMMMWIITALIAKIENGYSYWLSIVIIPICFFAYLVHQRTVAIIGIAILILLYLSVKNRKWKGIPIILLTTFICILGYRVLHRFQLNQFYSSDSSAIMNNVEISSSFVGNFISRFFYNIKDISYSLICKLSIVLISTFFTFFISCWYYIQNVKKRESKHIGIKSFIILSTICMIILSSIQMFADERKDLVVYSRYFDYVIPEMTLLGIGELFRHKKNKKIYVWTSIITIPLIMVSIWKIQAAKADFNPFSNPMWSALLHNSNSDILRAGIVLICLCLIACFLFNLIFEKKDVIKKVFLLLFAVMNIFMFRCADERINTFRDYFYTNTNNIVSIIKKLNVPIYYISSDEQSDYMVKEIQMLLYDRPISVIKSIEQIKEEKQFFLLSNSMESVFDGSVTYYGQHNIYLFGPEMELDV